MPRKNFGGKKSNKGPKKPTGRERTSVSRTTSVKASSLKKAASLTDDPKQSKSSVSVEAEKTVVTGEQIAPLAQSSKKKKPFVPSFSKEDSGWRMPDLPKKGDPRIGFSRIDPRFLILSTENPRTDFSSPKERKNIEALSDSIVEHDIIEPIVITPVEFVRPSVIKSSRRYTNSNIPLLDTEKATHIIVAGERRFRATMSSLFAYQERHGDTIPCVVRVFETESARLAVMFAENMHRSDVNAIDRAKHLRKIFDAMREEDPKATQTELSKITGTDQSQISQLLRLLELPEELQKRVYNRELSPMQALQLAGIRDGRTRKALLNARDNKEVNASQLSARIKAERAKQDYKDAVKGGLTRRPVGRPPDLPTRKVWNNRPISCICAACTEKNCCPHHPHNPYLEG